MKKYYTLALFFLFFSFFPHTSANQYLDAQYQNLYHAGVDVRDILYMRRIFKTELNKKWLSSCQPYKLPTPIYEPEKSGPQYFYWFAYCPTIDGQMFLGEYVWSFEYPFVRSRQYGISVDASQIMVQYSPNIHKTITFYKEYENYSRSSRIQYYVIPSHGQTLVIRSASGVIEWSVNLWPKDMGTDTEKQSLLQKILWDQWYHP